MVVVSVKDVRNTGRSWICFVGSRDVRDTSASLALSSTEIMTLRIFHKI